ncbi:hypothetical protein C789_4111 [Microcystis aeruginosa FACHB-905 = DIANCHI905]|nr:hypothetical protein C789_4111 [Microcystis aeruginosa FACHB-905 = DIANCHI905]
MEYIANEDLRLYLVNSILASPQQGNHNKLLTTTLNSEKPQKKELAHE